MGALSSHSTTTLTTTPVESARLATDADERHRPPGGREQRTSMIVRFDGENTVISIRPHLVRVFTTLGGC
jgi:hypothetical protein